EAAGRAVVARLTDQKPFVVSRAVGDGEVVMVTTTLDEREKWTDFAGVRSDAFVPFCQLTLAHLTGRRVPGGNQLAGQPILWYPKEATGGFELIQPVRPNETIPRRVRLGPAQAPSPGERLRVTAPATDTTDPGVYRVVPEGKAPGPDDPTFALNP